MSKGKLDKKLKSDPKFIPFNEKYDFDYVLEFLQKTKDSNDNWDDKFNALNSNIFNSYFVGIKDTFENITNENDISKETFLEIIITLANRDFYLATALVGKSFGNKKEWVYDEMINSTHESKIPELGDINIQSGLEASHDGLNTIMNMTLKNYLNSNNSHYQFNQIDNCSRLLGITNIYVLIKVAYDMAIWENYSIRLDKSQKELYISILDEKKQFFNKIGRYRLERNVFFTKMSVVSAFHEKNAFFKQILAEANKKRKGKRLKKVKVIEGELIPKLADGIEKESVLKEILSFSSITTYYDFIGNETLPNLTDVNLYDVIAIFSEVQSLFRKGFEIKKTETAADIENFDIYKLKIRKRDLINYVFLKTRFTKPQIIQVIELFCHTSGYYNIWERPLIEFGEYLHPIMLPLLSPNSFRILDYWLEEGGFDLDLRGELFEKHIKEALKYSLDRKGYEYKISSLNTFYNDKEEFEEIDLLIELKTITIIAEVKCIKYPFDPRDYHNMYSRLTEGAKQINRKADFIKNNINHFKNESYFSKPMIKLVITNYPIYSGCVINEVSITDFSLIENYFIHGALGKGRMVRTDQKIEIDESFHSEIKYYDNENEFSDNLEEFFKNPIPVHDKLKDIYIEKMLISFPDAEPKISMDYIKFKQGNKIEN